MNTRDKIKYYTRLIDELSKDGDLEELFWAYLERGISYLEEHEYELAISDFKEAGVIKPSEPVVYFNIGLAYTKLKNDSLAMEYFKKTIDLDEKNPFAYFELGNISYNNEKFNEAREYYTKAMRNGKKSSDIYYKRALTNFKLLNCIDAIADISHAIKMKPSNTDYYILRANIYLSMKDYRSAIDDLTHLIKIKPSNSIFRLNRSIAYATIGSIIKLIVTNSLPKSLVKVVEKTILPFEKDYHKYYEMAENDITIAIENEKSLFGAYYISPSYYITRGAILLSYGKEVPAIVDFSMAKTILKSYFPSKKNKTYQSMKALVELYLDNYEQSWKHLTDEVELPKNNILRACLCWKSAKDFEKTYFWFEKAIENGFDIFEVVDDIFEGYFLLDFLNELEKRELLSRFIKI